MGQSQSYEQINFNTLITALVESKTRNQFFLFEGASIATSLPQHSARIFCDKVAIVSLVFIFAVIVSLRDTFHTKRIIRTQKSLF